MSLPVVLGVDNAIGVDASRAAPSNSDIMKAVSFNDVGSHAARWGCRARTVGFPGWLVSGLCCVATVFALQFLSGNNSRAHFEHFRGAASESKALARAGGSSRSPGLDCNGCEGLPTAWLERVGSTAVLPGRTQVFCSNDAVASSQPAHADQSDISHRSCMVQNACLDQSNRWIFYTGAEAPPPSPSTPLCVGAACDDQPFVYQLPLRYDSSIVRPRVVVGSPPSPPLSPDADGASGERLQPAPAVHWIDASMPVFFQARHRPDNYFHSICDDFYGLFWALRRVIRHPAYSIASDAFDESTRSHGGVSAQGRPPADSEQPAAGSEGSKGSDGFTVVNLVIDNWPFESPSKRLAKRFRHVHYTDAASLRAEHGNPQLLCFQRVLMGTPGITVHRNAAFAWHPARTWSSPLDAATLQHDLPALAKLLTEHALEAGGVDLRAYAPPIRDTIVVVERQGRRQWTSVDAVLAGVNASLFDVAHLLPPRQTSLVGDDNFASTRLPYIVTIARFENMADAEVATLMQRAIMMVGVHGAGLINMLHMQPGSIVLEITPPSNPETILFFGSVARTLDLRHSTITASSVGLVPDFNRAVEVEPEVLRSVAGMLLSDSAAR